MWKILLVDDDLEYGKKIAAFLELEGYSLKVTDDPIIGIEEFTKDSYDLVISDYMMGYMDEFAFYPQ